MVHVPPYNRTTMLVAENIRASFPALQRSPEVLLDNAGGSQVPLCVADAIREYMLSSYVQLDADYDMSRRATETVERAHAFIELFMNAGDRGRVVLGSSTTALCAMLADAYRRAGLEGRDEIVVAGSAHEANAGPWHRLAGHGYRVRVWPFDTETFELRPESLAPLLSARTRLVAFPHVSNLFGRVDDARAMTRLAHDAGARVVVDGVAYGPHRAIDVTSLEADWYMYSTYKVFGPHMAALYGAHDAFAEIAGPNHFFIRGDDIPYKFEPGGVSHEGCAGLLGLWPYLASVTGAEAGDEPSRPVIEAAYTLFAELETALQRPLIDYLRQRSDVRIIGPDTSDSTRVCTVSFVHKTRRSRGIVEAAGRRGFGLRHGHCYAYRLCERLAELGVIHDAEDGVIRASLLHYNTADEVQRLIECLEGILR